MPLKTKLKYMRIIQSLLCAMAAVAALVLCVTTARGTEPPTRLVTNSTPLTVSITVITNAPEKYTTNATTHIVTDNFSIGKVTINNAYLLSLFGHWAKTNWPTGAKLVVGWDEAVWSGDVLVVDKSGTNVLFDASANPTNYFAVTYFYGQGAQTYKDVEANPGSDSYTVYDEGYFILYDDNVYLPFTNLVGYGAATTTFTQNWNAQNVDTTWKVTSDLTAGYNCSGDVFMDMEPVTVSGTANTSGGGKGDNQFFQ